MENNDYLIFHNMTSKKSEEKRYESLYEELMEKCHPNNFMDPYDKEKVDIANKIYAELRKNPYAIDYELKELRLSAVQGLGIHLSTQKLYEYLMQYCDPQLYTSREPYDAELVSQANTLYAQIHEHKDDIFELEKIEILAKPLIDSENKIKKRMEIYQRERMQEAKRVDDERIRKQIGKELKGLAWLSVIAVAITIAIILIAYVIDSI